MKFPRLFTPTGDQIAQLVAACPFALVVSHHEGEFHATPLPLLLQKPTEGDAFLLGHFARNNPQVAALQQSSSALIVFQGPQSYISPSWFADRTQTPTWNFATVHYSVRIEFHDNIDASRAAVELLTRTMESGRERPWQVHELGARTEKLLPGIVPFHAHILSTKAKFKLGQNERVDILQEALTGLEREDQTELVALMRAANAERVK